MKSKNFRYLVTIDLIIMSLSITALSINNSFIDKVDIEVIGRNNIIIYFIGFFLLFLTYIGYIHDQLKKLRNVNEYIYRILNNDYSLDIREYEEGEINNLKNDIYKVTMKLKNMSDNSLAGKKYLESTLSDISHQIKTPLTSMYVMNDLLHNEELDKNLRKEFLNKTRVQLERIEWLVSSLLKISRLDSGSVVLKKEKVNVKELIDISLEPLKISIELKEIELIVNVPKDVTFKGDLKWTSEALINIIKNAYEHTPKGGKVIIEGTNNPLYTEIVISDSGEGIPMENRKKIFERFFKGDSNKESIGIGLNMAKMIIEMEDGTINVESKVDKGTKFIIRFYKKVI